MFGFQSVASQSIEQLRGIIILGSASSVHDALPWQSLLRSWLDLALTAQIPTLGLCFGHQLLAHHFGGEVSYLSADRKKMKGLRVIDFAPDRLWGRAQQGPLVVSHAEAVITCPHEFLVSAKSDQVPVEAISHRSLPLWGIQAHPEATLAFLANQGIPPPEDPEELVFGHQIVRAFLQYAVD